MMTDMINFCGYVAYYALGKSILHAVYTKLFCRKNKYNGGTGRRLLYTTLAALAVWIGWSWLMTTDYAVWAVVIATVFCARIAWREFKTLGGILAGDWNHNISRFRLVDWYDWAEGFADFVAGNWSILGIFNVFNIFSRDSAYDEDRRNDEFWYDARWYYGYGDGRNG